MSDPAPESVASLAARALQNPQAITADEVQSLAGAVLNLTDEAPPPPTYTQAVIDELTARRTEFKRRADKRRNQPGFSANVTELDEWIAEIDAELA